MLWYFVDRSMHKCEGNDQHLLSVYLCLGLGLPTVDYRVIEFIVNSLSGGSVETMVVLLDSRIVLCSQFLSHRDVRLLVLFTET